MGTSSEDITFYQRQAFGKSLITNVLTFPMKAPTNTLKSTWYINSESLRPHPTEFEMIFPADAHITTWDNN